MSLEFQRKSRLGLLKTAHGEIRTPCFMPVGTEATVKSLHPEEVAATGAEILLGNTYHLMLRPTEDIVAAQGGLHKFMNWDKPILTDSGGFQVMSLAGMRKITEAGATFQSPVDGGKKHLLTPELSVQIQHKLDSNITMCLDECLPYPIPRKRVEDSMRMSLRWARRSFDAFVNRPGYGIFGIVQGSMFQDLREESVAGLTQIPFDGFAVGGLAIGEPQEIMFQVLDYTCNLLPTDKPRYLMGVGKPSDILGSVARGIDMFDCVMPTRSARHGQAFVRRATLRQINPKLAEEVWSSSTDKSFDGTKGTAMDTPELYEFTAHPINLGNACFANDPSPIDSGCSCPTCKNYSRAYVHHLMNAGEMLGSSLLTMHNLWFYQDLMREIRATLADY